MSASFNPSPPNETPSTGSSSGMSAGGLPSGWSSLTQQQQIERILRRVRELPAIPELVDKIVDLLNSANSSAAQIANLISYDPGLTSKILKLVNSSAYGFQRQISSIQHAIMILGFGNIRGLVLSASLLRLFEGEKSNRMNINFFWRHSLTTALYSRLLADHLGCDYAEDAFSAGMLHDIGKMVLGVYFPEVYTHIILEAKKQHVLPYGQAFSDVEEACLGLTHSELGYHVALKWKLPNTFCDVIRYHHHPEDAQYAPRLVAIVALANALSNVELHHAGVLMPGMVPESLIRVLTQEDDTLGWLHSIYELIKQPQDEVDGWLASLAS